MLARGGAEEGGGGGEADQGGACGFGGGMRGRQGMTKHNQQQSLGKGSMAGSTLANGDVALVTCSPHDGVGAPGGQVGSVSLR